MFLHEIKKKIKKKLLDLSCDQSLYGKRLILNGLTIFKIRLWRKDYRQQNAKD